MSLPPLPLVIGAGDATGGRYRPSGFRPAKASTAFALPPKCRSD